MMSNGEGLTAFERYGVVLQKIDALSTRIDVMDAQWNRRLDRFEEDIAHKQADHEERIRSIEGRHNLIISIGILMWAVSIVATWIIARGGPW